MTEKQAGGEILGRLAGLASRPFVGAGKSQAVQSAVTGGITKRLNNPVEGALRRSGVHGAIRKAYEYGTIPVPGTPKFVQPVMKDPAQRAAYANWRADDHIHTLAQNPELVGALASPIPGTGEAYLAGKHLLGRALGVNKLAAFADELIKITGEDPAEEAYWAFDTARAGRGEYEGRPQSERDAFKLQFRRMMSAMEKTAEVFPYQQVTQWTCSAGCLKAVFAHWGLRVPELVLIDAIGAKKGRGAETDQIAAAARKFGFTSFEYSFESIDQAKVLLDQDIPIICDIQSFNNPGKGHYVVMVAADEKRVELMDPNTPGNWRVISRADMDARWWDRAMAPPHDHMWKWGIIVVPPDGDADGPPPQ